jgi:hypothetical protein
MTTTDGAEIMAEDKAYLVWHVLSGHIFGAYWAPNAEAAMASAIAELDIETEPPERLEALDIEDLLTESIRGLETEDWTAGGSGYHIGVYLDPAKLDVYQWCGVGSGYPEPVWAGRHLTIFEHATQADLVPASVIEALLDRVGLLTQVCVEHHNGVDADDCGTAHCQLERTDFDLVHYWDPGDWYQDCDREIEQALADGATPEQIVEAIGTGDRFNGMVRTEAAVNWMTERVAEILDQAVVDIAETVEPDEIEAAMARAYRLHCLPAPTRDHYGQAVLRALEHGHKDLAQATTAAALRLARLNPRPMPCYGCGKPLPCDTDVFCGDCGGPER